MKRMECRSSAAKVQRPLSWLLWTSFMLVSVVLAAVLASSFDTGWAAAALEPAPVEPPAEGAGVSAEGEAWPAQALFTYTLPIVTSDFRMAHLAVAKSAYPTAVISDPGTIVTYTVTIQNEGDTTGKLLTVYDTLPTGFTYQDMAAGSDVQADPSGTTGTITWSFLTPLSMPPGSQKQLIYLVSPSPTEGQYTNYASVTAQAASVQTEPASATITVEPGTLLEEDFASGIGRWTPFLNHHRLELGQWYWGSHDGVGGGGALTHDCCVGDKVASDALMMYLGTGSENWTNYRAETWMYLTGGVDNRGNPEPDSGDPIGLWVRGHYQDSENESQWVSGYYVVLVGQTDTTNHHIRIAKMQQPGDCDACLKPERMYNFDNPLFKARSADLPGPFEHYRWYKLAVEVRDANIKVYLDDHLVLDWTDPTLPYLTGSVGFKVHETQTASFDNLIVTPLP
jgi:uncharacterized repeat protein (TIGR01451 family)